tara:strand:+ start:55 stop:906 length:852 start_codon:yes stop_codon:yes gene_type:complete
MTLHSILYRIKRFIQKLIIELKISFIKDKTTAKYNFDLAKDYWHNVPKAEGSNPFNTKSLESITDNDLNEQFKSEQIIARKKQERQLGYNLIINNLKNVENPNVMDYGSGIGFYGFEVLEKVPSSCVTFVDINKQSLHIISRIAKVNGLENRVKTQIVKESNASDLNFDDNYFDLIISMGVLHHTPYAADIVTKLTPSLKRKGIFQVMLYNDYFMKRLSRKKEKKLNVASFGEMTDPPINGMKNPYSEPYNDNKTKDMFGNQYDMISSDYPTCDYNTYCFLKK